VQSIVQRLREHRIQLPEKFGSYQLLEVNVKPPVKPYVLSFSLVIIFFLLYIHGVFLSAYPLPMDPDSCVAKQESLYHF
jgi:hypothetical protein